MSVFFYPTKSFKDMCEQAARDMNAYRRATQRGLQAVWNEWAGTRLTLMMNDPDVTKGCLTNAEPALRLAAASLIAEYWPPHEAFAAPCLYLAFADPESAIRGAAIASLLYKLYPFVQDPSGLLGKLLRHLRSLEAPIDDELAREVRKEVSDDIQRAEEQGLLLCKQLAGDHFIEMVQAGAAVATYLEHPNANLRRAALLILYKYWRANVDMRNICMHLTRNDPDIEVRIEAQGVLSAVSAQTNDAEVGHLLAQIVRDSSEPIRLRKAAYISLFIVRPMPISRVLHATSADFPKEVDWAFVDTFLY